MKVLDPGCRMESNVNILQEFLDPLSPKPNGTEPPACKGLEVCDAMRPQGRVAEGRTGVPSNE